MMEPPGRLENLYHTTAIKQLVKVFLARGISDCLTLFKHAILSRMTFIIFVLHPDLSNTLFSLF